MLKKLLTLATLFVLAACSPSSEEPVIQSINDSPAEIEINSSSALEEVEKTIVAKEIAANAATNLPPISKQSTAYKQGAH